MIMVFEAIKDFVKDQIEIILNLIFNKIFDSEIIIREFGHNTFS